MNEGRRAVSTPDQKRSEERGHWWPWLLALTIVIQTGFVVVALRTVYTVEQQTETLRSLDSELFQLRSVVDSNAVKKNELGSMIESTILSMAAAREAETQAASMRSGRLQTTTQVDDEYMETLEHVLPLLSTPTLNARFVKSSMRHQSVLLKGLRAM